MKFYSEKGKVLLVIMIILLAALISLLAIQEWPGVIILLLVESFFLWMWFDTYYVIKDGLLFYKSALIRGSIPVNSIHQIEKLKGVYSGGLKPALSMKGLVVKYNRYDDIYISPEKADEFIAELQKINPDITVN